MDDASTVPAEEPTIDIEAFDIDAFDIDASAATDIETVSAQEVVPDELNFDKEFDDTCHPANDQTRCQNEAAKDISQVLAIPTQIISSPRDVAQSEIVDNKVFEMIDLTDDLEEEPAVTISPELGNVKPVAKCQDDEIEVTCTTLQGEFEYRPAEQLNQSYGKLV